MTRNQTAILAAAAGAGMLAVELIVAKLMAGTFGTSLNVWASVLAVTMLSLAAGYFAGGAWVDRSPRPAVLTKLFGVAAALALAAPWLGAVALSGLAGLGLAAGSVAAALLLLGPALVFLGMTSPALIRLGTTDIEQSGSTAGLVYAFTTAGGVAMSLVCSLWLIPSLGLRIASLAAAALLTGGAALSLTARARPD